jgi:hypothetical protein
VAPDGSGDFTSIQAAIDAASSGDDILVRAGTYVENIDYEGKNLTVRSESGAASTTIDGSAGPAGARSCVVFRSGETATAVLHGFTLTRGSGTTLTGVLVGGGLYITNGARPTIRECVVTGNVAANGAGAFVSQGGLTCQHSLFAMNRADTYGSGITAVSAQVTISDCRFEYNVAVAGDGAVSFADAVVAAVDRTVFRGNEAQAGAGLNLGQPSTTCFVRDCDFFENIARELHGGGLRVNRGTCEVERCLFVGNRAELDGGGMVVLHAPYVPVRNCTFYGNLANREGAHLEYFDANGSVQNAILAEGQGGGGASVYGSVAFACCDAWQNAGGSYIGIADPTGVAGNIALDPFFCDPFGEEFTLQENSPCAPFSPENPTCDLVGARPVACGITPVRMTTWGTVKSMYRTP